MNRTQKENQYWHLYRKACDRSHYCFNHFTDFEDIWNSLWSGIDCNDADQWACLHIEQREVDYERYNQRYHHNYQ